jgi:hypothetical protein
LITVDPVSSAILSIELTDHRTAEAWKDHLSNLVANGFSPRLIVSDAGGALKAAHSDIFADIPWQLDTFHGIAHRLGDWDRRLEKSAYNSMEKTEKCEKTLASAKSDTVIDKRLNNCFKLEEKEEQAIDLHDDFTYLYNIIIHQLTSFNSAGTLRPRDQTEGNITAALDLMATLDHKTIAKEATLIKKTLPDVLIYFNDASNAFARCQKLIEDAKAADDVLHALALAWQWNKEVIKAKKTDRKHQAIEQRDLHLELAELLFIGNEEQFISLKEAIYAELDQIIQASSMVECINSILRPYLNASKNQVTQEFLNLFMFYHNHRRYHAGKRKGKTPMELLMGKEQKEDWITLLQKEVKEPTLST